MAPSLSTCVIFLWSIKFFVCFRDGEGDLGGYTADHIIDGDIYGYWYIIEHEFNPVIKELLFTTEYYWQYPMLIDTIDGKYYVFQMSLYLIYHIMFRTH